MQSLDAEFPDSRDGLGMLLALSLAGGFVAFLAGAGLLLMLPIETAWKTSGVVAYRKELRLAADFEGVVTQISAAEGSPIGKGETVVIYRNRDLSTQAKSLEIRVASEKSLLAKLSELHGLGYLDARLLAEKQGEIRRLEYDLSALREDRFASSFAGVLRYPMPPEKMVGRFVTRGETLAIITEDSTKQLEISLGLEYADHISPGTSVKVSYRSVTDYFQRSLKARVVRMHMDRLAGVLLLECAPVDRQGESTLAGIVVGTPLDARIRIRQASYLDRFLERDLGTLPPLRIDSLGWMLQGRFGDRMLPPTPGPETP